MTVFDYVVIGIVSLSNKLTSELDHIMNRIFKLQDTLETKHKRRPARS